MPSTINGIGTHYYGKRNYTERTAACASCQRVGNLESYDTRLWFVVVLIPIIPLGRKRILDKCPACTRHYVMQADVYEQSRQLQTSASRERFRREPTAAAALEAHGQLLAFHEHEQAAEFRRSALERIPGHAGLRVGLAAQLRDASSFAESAPLFEEALDLDPDLPEARMGVAMRRIAEGRLDEARDLLDFLTGPGEGRQYGLLPLDVLANNYQRVGRHEEALDLAEVLLRELPSLGDNHAFRGFVGRSEKALLRPESILPGRHYSVSGLFRSEGSPYAPWQRRLAIGGVASTLLLGGLALNNESIRRHRRLHVVNATGRPAQVRVDDRPAVAVDGMSVLAVPEGRHVLKVSGPVDETREITIDSPYFDRWFRNPLWLLNVGGEAVFKENTLVYSANGVPSHGRLVVGEAIVSWPDIDYIFTPAPAQLEVKGKDGEVTKTEFGWVRGEDHDAFLTALETDRKAALDFAEKRLRRSPGQADLLRSYMARTRPDEHGRVEAFFKSGLGRRPVDVAWHRAYQSFAELNRHEAGLLPFYDRELAADPSSAPLLYLRGRIDPDWDAQESFYRRALAADPKLGWAWLGLAARAMSGGDWDATLAAAHKAKELQLNEPERIAELLHLARMAKGEAKAIVEEGRAAFNTRNVTAFLAFLDALASSGLEGEIDRQIDAWCARLPAEVQTQVAAQLKATGLYYAGKLEGCAEFAAANAVIKASPAHLHALLALGRMEEATDDSVLGPLRDDPMHLLSVSVGFGLAGKPEEAARWRDRAASQFVKVGGATDFAKAAGFLGGPKPPSIRELHHVYLSPENKAILLAALADRFPGERGTFLTEASRFNFLRKPSYQLIRRAIAAKPQGRP